VLVFARYPPAKPSTPNMPLRMVVEVSTLCSRSKLMLMDTFTSMTESTN
jgi:hypothetical protein